MAKIASRANKIPKFIKKLVQILQNKNHSQIISWLTHANGFQIFNTSRFIEQILPTYFSHNNLASFVRQLNMYGFIRPKDSDQHIYEHAKFIRGNLNSMRQIQRRIQDRKGQHYCSDSQEQAPELHESQPSSQQLSQLCMKLMDENQKLKKLNNDLVQKMSYLTKNQAYQQTTSSGNQSASHNDFIYCKQLQKLKVGNQTQSQQKSNQQKYIPGFHFGLSHNDWNSRLSYMTLIEGARQHEKQIHQ